MYNAKNLIEMALEARSRAYCPYSGFAVGAALLARDGRVFLGCNVESSSFSPTNCAERTALFAAVAAGVREFEAIAVAGGPSGVPPVDCISPCGVCRQALAEFNDGSMAIIMARSQDDYIERTLGELLPMSFGAKDLH